MIKFLTVLSFLLSPALSFAQESIAIPFKTPSLEEEQISGVYLRGDAGLSFLNTTRAPVFGLGLGMKQNHWRGDVTLDYTANKASSLRVTGLLNGYYDFGTWSSFTPYLGLGLGFTHLEGAGLTRQVRLTTALNAGVSYAINQALLIDLSYRLTYLTPLTQSPQSTHLLRLGLRWKID
jgi:opacity protein-like surface antigen